MNARANPSQHFAAWLLPAALTLGSVLAAAWLSLLPVRPGPLALLFPPWWSGARAMLAAAPAGAIIRFGALPWIVVIAPGLGGAAEAPTRTGAWLILDPQKFGGCGL